MLSIKSSGSFKKFETFAKRVSDGKLFNDLNRYGESGVSALASATPKDSGLTASSWAYRIVRRNGRFTIEWFNTNENDGANIAILIQYGHGTGTGAYIQGIDYINPAIRPIFEEIAENVWKKVTRA